MTFHGYSMTPALDKALDTVTKDILCILKSLITNLTDRFSDFETPLNLAVANLLDTKTYLHKTPADIMSSVVVIASRFKFQLECCSPIVFSAVVSLCSVL